MVVGETQRRGVKTCYEASPLSNSEVMQEGGREGRRVGDIFQFWWKHSHINNRTDVG